MLQVEAINSSGKYFIANNETKKHANNDSKLCLENLVSLVVPESNEKNREEKVYSFEEIKDVQSKLMLIAGEAENGKEEVDQFNEVCLDASFFVTLFITYVQTSKWKACINEPLILKKS